VGEECAPFVKSCTFCLLWAGAVVVRASPALVPMGHADWPLHEQPASTPVSELLYTRPHFRDILPDDTDLADYELGRGQCQRLLTCSLPLVGPERCYKFRPHLNGSPYPKYMPQWRGEDDVEDFSFRHRFHIRAFLSDSSLVPLTRWTCKKYTKAPHVDDILFRWCRPIDALTHDQLGILKLLPVLHPMVGDPPVPCMSDIIQLRTAALAMARQSCALAGVVSCRGPCPTGLPLSLAEDYRRHYAYYVALYPHALVHRHD
jgi:hypothetical protein